MKYPYKRLQIAFLTSTDARDKRTWSGTHYSLAASLQKHCGDVHFLGPEKPSLHITLGRILSLASRKLFKKRFDYSHSFFISKKYASVFSKKLSPEKYDLIFAPASSAEIAFLKTEIPILYLSDATFSVMIDYYAAYTRLFAFSKKQALEIERKALAKSACILYPSGWAASSAIHELGARPDKVHIIPFGANIEDIPSKESILQKKKGKVCRLLFLAVDWERKGGDIAIDTLKNLKKSGIHAQLTICGCVPPPGTDLQDVQIIPFLNKNDDLQRRQLIKLLLDSDILILPTRAECAGIVFSEASAFGLPIVATDTGGVNSGVREGKNGYLLPYEAGGKEYAGKIAEIYCDDDRYYEMVSMGRQLYEQELNWDAWGEKVRVLLEGILPAHR